MAIENETNVAQETPNFGADEYIANLQRIKESTVPREEFERLLEDNKRMANALANGLSVDNEPEEEEIDIEAVRKYLFDECDKPKSDLAYFEKFLQLRQWTLDNKGVDVLLPCNGEYVVSQADAAEAQLIADNIQEAIDAAEGDPSVFTAIMKRKCGGRIK